MKPVVKILVFLSGLSLALQLISMAYDRACIGDFTNKIFWILSKRNNSYDVAFLGSSRCQSNLSGEYVEKQFGKKSINIGNGGSSPIDQYVILENFLEQGNKVGTLVLTLDDDGLDTSSFTQPFQYYNFMPVFHRAGTRHVIEDFLGLRYVVFFLPFYKYTEFNEHMGMINLFNRYRRRPAPFDPWGSKLSDKEFVPQSFRETRLKIHPIARKYFVAILDLCRQKSIRVVMVYPPDYIDIQKTRLNREEVFAFYRKTAADRNIDLLMFDQDARFAQTTYFRDARHLNKSGAVLLSDLVMRHLLKSGL